MSYSHAASHGVTEKDGINYRSHGAWDIAHGDPFSPHVTAASYAAVLFLNKMRKTPLIILRTIMVLE